MLAGLVELQLPLPSPTLPLLVHPVLIPLPPGPLLISSSRPPNPMLMSPRNVPSSPPTVPTNFCLPCPFQPPSTSPIVSILPRSQPPQPPDTWQQIQHPPARFFETEVGESDALARDAELYKILRLIANTLNNATPLEPKPQHQDGPQNHHQHWHYCRHVCRPSTPLRSHGHPHSCHWHLKQRRPHRRRCTRSPSAPRA
ncbi:hypothetical protein BJY52DRAFT_1307960 [Lactarius psammicola]|nr:hypothetical protein BJY52DRAFT_1307960 [Lactarius psammicola]